MTKAELVNAIAIQTGYDKTTISNVLESLMENVKTSVSQADPVFLRGFGTFTTKTRAAKIARNIARNESMVVPMHQIPFFKPSPEFVEMV